MTAPLAPTSGTSRGAWAPLASPQQRPTGLSRPAGSSGARRSAGDLAAEGKRTLRCSATVEKAVEGDNGAAEAAVASGEGPQPIVHISNHEDPFATVVTIEFGDKLGELLDTVASLKNLGLNIRRAKLTPGSATNKFYLTDKRTSEKITKSKRVEEIRLSIFNNLLKYHPESGQSMAWGIYAKREEDRDPLNPLGPKNRHAITTKIAVNDAPGGSHSEVFVKTRDRPGLLTDIVKTLKDINVNVVSAEIDTEGPWAKDWFYVTYHGEPLTSSMTQLLTNALQYQLSLAEVEREESY